MRIHAGTYYRTHIHEYTRPDHACMNIHKNTDTYLSSPTRTQTHKYIHLHTHTSRHIYMQAHYTKTRRHSQAYFHMPSTQEPAMSFVDALLLNLHCVCLSESAYLMNQANGITSIYLISGRTITFSIILELLTVLRIFATAGNSGIILILMLLCLFLSSLMLHYSGCYPYLHH